MQQDLVKLVKRPQAHWFEDGLGELIGGAYLFILGIFFVVEGAADPGTLLRKIAGYSGLIFLVGGIWIIRLILPRLKERWTYGRTGYTAFRKPTTKQRYLTLFVSAFISAIVAGVVSNLQGNSLVWLPFFQGMVIGGFLLYQGISIGIRRFILIGPALIILGLSFAALGYSELIGMGLFFTAGGVLMMLSGWSTFRVYLRLPVLDLEDEGERGGQDA